MLVLVLIPTPCVPVHEEVIVPVPTKNIRYLMAYWVTALEVRVHESRRYGTDTSGRELTKETKTYGTM